MIEEAYLRRRPPHRSLLSQQRRHARYAVAPCPLHNPITTDLVRHNEPALRANRDLTHCGKRDGYFNHVGGGSLIGRIVGCTSQLATSGIRHWDRDRSRELDELSNLSYPPPALTEHGHGGEHIVIVIISFTDLRLAAAGSLLRLPTGHRAGDDQGRRSRRAMLPGSCG